MGGWIVPRWPPLGSAVVKGSWWVGLVILPGFVAAHTVWEVAICATDGHIENEVVFSIEWSIVCGIGPWVWDGSRESSGSEHISALGVKVQDQLLVDERLDIILGPLNLIDVEVVGEGATLVEVASMACLPSIIWPFGSPMKGATEALIVLVVASGLITV